MPTPLPDLAFGAEHPSLCAFQAIETFLTPHTALDTMQKGEEPGWLTCMHGIHMGFEALRLIRMSLKDLTQVETHAPHEYLIAALSNFVLIPGLLGAVEGVSFLTLVVSIAVFGLQILQKGSLPGITG